MLILPIVLTFLLGTALAPIFDRDSESTLIPSSWLYYIEDSVSGERLHEFLEKYQSQLNMYLTPEADREAAIAAVSMRIADAYLVYFDGEIVIYQNEHAPVSTRWLEVVFSNYLMRAAIVDDILENVQDFTIRQFLRDYAMDVGEHVSPMQIDTIRQPNAMGYYAIAMITLTSCYAMIVLILALESEIRRSTLKRYLLSGKSLFSFLFSKSLGICIVLIAKIAIVMLFSTFVYRVYFGAIDTWLLVLGITALFTFAVMQFASILCLIFKNLSALNVALNVAFLPAMLFLGGAYLAYYRLIAIGLGDIIVFSPIYHLNRGIFNAIYLNSFDNIRDFAIITALASLVMLVCTFILSKWRGNSWVQ